MADAREKYGERMYKDDNRVCRIYDCKNVHYDWHLCLRKCRMLRKERRIPMKNAEKIQERSVNAKTAGAGIK